MEAIQQWLSQWMSDISTLIPLGYAFGAGMVSSVNPCGFAMLPAYLGLYLGSGSLGTAVPAGGSGSIEAAEAVPRQLGRAVVVAAVVTAGFVLLFGGVGLLISAVGRLVVNLVPWIALGIGGVLVLLGGAMLTGRHLSAGFAARLASRLGDPGSTNVKGFFIFGVAYATASLSCTLPIFLTVVGGSLAVTGFTAAAVQFVSYALGMGAVIVLLTLGIAVFKGATVSWLRAGLPYVERGSALLLIVAGVYIMYYWLIKGGLIATFA